MKTNNNSLLPFGQATTHTPSVYMTGESTTSPTRTRTTNTSLMRAFAVFFSLLLGYSSLNAQIISTIAGTGTSGFSGDGGLATAATISGQTGITQDASGNIYFSDRDNSRIRKITASTGIITTICGTGTSGFSGDGGLATAAEINFVWGVAVDASNNIYFTDSGDNRIRKITASTGIITTIAGTGTFGFSGDGGAATVAQVSSPVGIAINAIGDIYFVDSNQSRIRKITASTGIITTIAGTGIGGFSGDGAAATAAQISAIDLTVDVNNNVYIISENFGGRIRKITASTGIITTICGTGTFGFSGDGGAATAAQISSAIYGISTDASSNIYFTDSNNSRIRKITASTGIITTICGTGAFTSTGDGGLATAATISFPVGLSYVNGKLCIGEFLGSRIRQINNCPTITISPASLAGGTVGTSYSQTLTQTGLVGTPAWSVSAGTLPAGLTLASATGVISGTPTTAGTPTFTVSVGDGSGCTQTKVYSIAVACPTVTVTPTPTTQSYVVGTAISSITLGASGVSGATYTYAVTSGALPAGVTLSAGVISGTPTTSVGGTFTITATSSIGACTGTAVYNFSVFCPFFIFTNTTATVATVGGAYSLDAGVTGNTQAVVYSVLPALPAGLSISSTTGAISGTPTTATASNTYTVTATQGTCTATQAYTFAVVCPNVVFNNTTASGATVGTPYTINIDITGNTGFYFYSVSPALPAGLSISTTSNVISGTPTTATASNTYTVTVAQGTCNYTQTYTFAVVCPTLVFGVTTATGATVGTAYSLDAGVTGNTGTIVYSVLPTLPVGLNISSSTGLISGTPTAPVASVTYTVTATQGTCVATQAYTFAVACVGIVISPASLTGGTVGSAYSQTITQTGLTGTPTWSITGTLPNGLTIDSATGIISGTPTTIGISAFAVSLTDGACSQTKNYSIAVACPVITFTNTTASGAIVGIAYSLNAGVTGNTDVVVYSISPVLPAGLSLNTATGVISGAASAVTASATYTVTATQTVDCATTQSYTFGVIPACSPVVLGLASIPNATIGTPYSQTFTATGGTTGATYTFTTTSPQLALNGLSLSPTGVLSGTPTSSTSITFRVTATTTPNNCPGFKDYTITINLNPATSVDNSLASSVKVSPNPSNGDFNVDFGTINTAKSSVRVYDMQGKVVFTSENNSNLRTISLDKFANGIYLLEVKTENGRITKRLSKTN